MGRVVRRLGGALLAITAVSATVALAARYWPQTQQQRDAIAQMEQPTPPVRGRDGSDLAWLLDHDVPAGERQAAAAALRAFLERHAGQPGASDRPDHPLRAFPELPGEAAAGTRPCDSARRCLDDVRARLPEVASELGQQRRRVELGREMASYDGLRFGLSPSPHHPLQHATRNSRLVRMHFAHEFLAGRKEQAVSGLCLDLAGWRRIASDSDTLVGSMLSLGAVRSDALLLAEMIAELPRDSDLPPSCDAALAPTADAELDSCPMLRYEYRYARSSLADPADSDSVAARLLMASIGERHRDATLAMRMAGSCGTSALATARADRSLTSRFRTESCSTFRLWIDPIGCTVLEASSVDAMRLSRYADRRTDAAAMLAGLRTVAWLRTLDVPEEQWDASLKSRPGSLGLRRTPTLSADHSTLSIPLLAEWQGTAIELAVKPQVATPITK